MKKSDFQDDQPVSAIASLREIELNPSAHMKNRILARLHHAPVRNRVNPEVLFWRWIAGFATAACALMAWMHFLKPVAPSALLAMQPYVIHLDLGGARLAGATSAEVELPNGVRFVSKAHPEVTELRSLRLDLPEEIAGRSRLPFVVQADRPGTQQLKLRIWDQNMNLLQERIVSVKFTDQTAQVL